MTEAFQIEPMDEESVFVPFTSEDFRREIKRVKRKRVILTILGVLISLLIVAAIVAVVVFKLPGSLVTVPSEDMAPALSQGQTVLVQSVQTPAGSDIIAYSDMNGEVRFSRVIALGGEFVNVTSDKKVVVSDVSLEGSSSPDVVSDGAVVVAARQVPEGTCFIMADADDNPFDALYRSENYVTYDKIRGRVATW